MAEAAAEIHVWFPIFLSYFVMRTIRSVMAGLVPAIHVLVRTAPKDMDTRDKRGHDE
jgi:hypothetical protein